MQHERHGLLKFSCHPKRDAFVEGDNGDGGIVYVYYIILQNLLNWNLGTKWTCQTSI